MNILLVNLHSGLNLGDDGIMAVTLRDLLQVYPDANIVLAANDPDSWDHYSNKNIRILPSLCTWIANCRLGIWGKSTYYLTPLVLLFLGFAVFLYTLFNIQIKRNNKKQNELLQAYYKADLVLSVGGGNFYAHHRFSISFFWHLVTISFAIALGKRVVMLPQSIGPIQGRFQRWLASVVFRRVAVILLREEESYRFLTESLHVTHPNSFVLADLAFALRPINQDISLTPQKEKIKIGLTLIDRGSQDNNFVKQAEYEIAIINMLKKLDGTVENLEVYLFSQVLGPSDSQNDQIISKRMYRKLSTNIHVHLVPPFDSADSICTAYAKMDLIIGTRMHTGIFALINHIPVIVIGYQPKACGMMHLFDLEEFCIEIEHVQDNILYLLCLNLLTNRDEIRTKIVNGHQVMLERLHNWTRYLA